MFDYLKFSSFHLSALITIVMISLGGWYISIGFVVFFVVYIGGDWLLGDDITEPEYNYPKLLTWQLWLALPLICMLVFVSVWQVASVDVFHFGLTIASLTGVDINASKEATSIGHYLVLASFVGINLSILGTLTGHELTHRTWDPVSMLIGRWLLAFTFDANFSIEHVYGHHRYVCTKADPATAPRGRSVYAHMFISTIKGYISAWKLEKFRLLKKHQAVFSFRNVAIRGVLMSAFLVVSVFFIAGWEGAVFFIVIAILGKFNLEIINFIEHYGMVRHPELPVQPRHSWNTNKRVSSWAMFNLTRHSHHHAQGEVPFHQLKPFSEAPMMIGGYLTTYVIALIPPLWNKLMVPKVLEWDQKYASKEELLLASEANKMSGIKALENVQYAAL
jgi:alkane 1-monooxygenase